MRKASLQTLTGKCFYRFIPLIVGMLFSFSTKAQDFNYSFAKDSVAWQELNTQTILNSTNSAWNFSYKIPIGFSFEYLGWITWMHFQKEWSEGFQKLRSS